VADEQHLPQQLVRVLAFESDRVWGAMLN